MRKLIVLTVAITASITLFAQEDTKAGKSERNVMLNAESASAPREINIGLPESGDGAVLYVDGIKHAYGLPKGQFHWAGGNAYEPIKTMSIIETLIFTGEIGIAVNSDTRMGTDIFSGAVSATSSSNGLIRLDAALRGPLSSRKGWFFSAGIYANLDPTNVPAPHRRYVDNKQIGQFSLMKKWDVSSFAVSYRFSRCADNMGSGYAFAPFIFDGKGGISQYEGFRIGQDCYMPSNDDVDWLDLASGKILSGKLGDMDERFMHDVMLDYSARLSSGWELSLKCHMATMPYAKSASFALSSISQGTIGYSLMDGSPYFGPVQNRIVTVSDASNYDYELLAQAKKTIGRHYLHLGADVVLSKQYEAGSTFNMAHSVEEAPVRLLYNGESTWDYNKSATYMDAWRRNLAFYALDTWHVNSDLRFRTGVRLRPVLNNTICAPSDPSGLHNKRASGGFSLASEDALLENKQLCGLDYAFSEDVSWRIAGRLFANAEGFYSITNKSTTYFKGANVPSVKPIGNAYARGGFAYDNSWMDVTALLSFITSWNNAKVMTVSDHDSGETIPWTAEYGIRTIGFTLDGNVHFGGFKTHLMCTLQDPRYKNYRNEFSFSSGLKVLDYTGKYVTGISKFMLEFDPSYSWSRYKLWTSVRYYSRQYASRNNLAYFDGHFETFAGLDVKFRKHDRLSINVINVLGQSGAKGSVDFIDTMEDASLLKGCLLSGKYIRPFCVEMSYTYEF